MRHVIIIICSILFAPVLLAQNKDSITQSIQGRILDNASGEGLESFNVIIPNTSLVTTSDEDGFFSLDHVPLGRYTLQISGVGYHTELVTEVLVRSAQPVYLEIELTQKRTMLEEIEVNPRVNKDKSINEMALVGAQMFSVEEASRFAGGMDDPARLVANYAGVATPSTSNNGISIRGNAPSLLQWKLEGVEIPNPNHFADIDVLGGGFLSALSGNVLSNSDFFIGAFPAEYNNAVSGVFDMQLRAGSRQNYHHTFQLGMLGIDLASEGPISRDQGSSYIVNYRYSTTGLLEKLKNENMGGTLGYQDLNLKLNFPTKKAGTFSLWGIGLIDEVTPSTDDLEDRKYLNEGVLSSANQKSGAMGLSHQYFFNNQKTTLKSTFALTHLDNHIQEEFYDLNEEKSPKTDLSSKTTNLIFTSVLKHKFGPNHLNKTGVTFTNIRYHMNLDFTPIFDQPLENINNAQGETNLISAYTQSLIHLSDQFSVSAGVNLQYLALNGNTAVEPRLALEWQASPQHAFALGYGLHSRMEKADVYFVKGDQGSLPNKALDFTRSHHFMLSYNRYISQDMNLKIEPYFQLLYDIPVSETGTYSILNRKDFYMDRILVSEGEGQNYGIDLTFSKYLTNGMYYMLTGSLFQSKYKAADGNWYDTRYNRGFIANGLIGREWMFGRDMLGINLKASVLGGQRYTPVDEAGTLDHPDKEVQYDESRMFSQQFSPMFIGDFSISYRMNRARLAHTFSIKSVNASQQKEYIEHRYNLLTERIEPFFANNSLFNVSYRIDF